MGVRGLSTFVNNDGERSRLFWKNVELKNSLVIIDGNNLRHMLYHWCPGAPKTGKFGGDYEKYADYIKSFFCTLKCANVKALVIMDGSYEKSGMKRSTVIKRLKDQIHRSVNNFETIYPLMGKKVFIDVIKQIDNVIGIYQSNYEGDINIARLGYHLNCPVLSNDSDFIVFNVDLITLDSLHYHIGNYEDNFIPCRKFDKVKFMSYFKISNVDLIFLMASLCGNDYIPLSSFSKLFAQIKQPKKKSMSDRHKKISGLLSWLSRESSSDVAINQLLNFIPTEKRSNLKDKIYDSMNVYRCQLKGLSENEEKLFKPKEIIDILFREDRLSSYNDNEFPEFFYSNFYSATYPVWFAQASVNREFFTTTQVEDRNQSSTHSISFQIIETILNLIINIDKEAEEEITIQMHLRQGARLHSIPFHINKAFVNLYTINENINHSSFKDIWFKTMNAKESFIETINPKYKILIISLIYFWNHHTELKDRSIYIKCVIIYVLLRNVFDSTLKVKYRNPNIEPDENVLQERFNENLFGWGENNLCGNDCWLALKKLLPYFSTSVSKSFDVNIVHNFNQIQSVIYYSDDLNRILQFPITDDNPDMTLIWNSVFIYNLFSHISNYRDRNAKIQTIFNNNEPVIKVMDQAWNFFESILKGFNEESSNLEGRQIKKKSKKKYEENQIITNDIDENEILMSNKFKILSI